MKKVSPSRLISWMFGFDDKGFREWCDKEGYNPDTLLKISNIMGNYYHLMLERGRYDKWLEKSLTVRLKTDGLNSS